MNESSAMTEALTAAAMEVGVPDPTGATQATAVLGVNAPDRILDAALRMAERGGWDSLHLHDVASELGIALSEVRRHYDQKDSIAEAWFDRADRAMLRAGDSAGWRALPARERLFRVIWTWLDALAPHRRLTRAMLQYKLQPEHLHLQALGVTRISRTVQWFREAAGLRSTGPRRELEEAALTSLYLATFAFWLNDDSPNGERSRWLLDQLLGAAEAASMTVDRLTGSPAERTAPRFPSQPR
jgi:ubiquinone biosynthesis protein COQ9